MRTMLLLPILAAAGIAVLPAPVYARDGSADVQFRDAYTLVRLADSAYERDDLTKARGLYSDALETYGALRRKFPDWQPGVVDYRIRYCQRRMDLIQTADPSGTNASPAAVAATPDSTTPTSRTPAPDSATTESARKAALALADLIEASRRQLMAGNSAAAKEGLLTALKINPDHPTTRLLLAFAQCQTGQFEDAATMLDYLIEDEPKNAKAYLYRGAARIGMGRTDDAIEDINQSLKLNPDSREAHYNLAQALIMKSVPDKQAALEHYRKAVELGAAPDPDLEARIKTAGKSR